MTALPADPTEIRGDVRAPLRPLPAGSTLAGYRIESHLGRGGMGVVYRAEHLHLGRKVALKLLAPQFAQDKPFRDRFIRESRLAASIEHGHIVTVYDAGEVNGLLYIAMRLVEGTDIARLLAEHGPLEPAEAVLAIEQIAAALDAAHARGLVHRDVKPANVLVDAGGYYLADFGLSKDVSSESAMTGSGVMVGTLHYAAPEQIEGGQVDARTDVYALGCVLYHCLTGDPPYPKDSDVQVMYAHLQAAPPPVSASDPDLPAQFDGVIARAMAKSPADRYPTAGALAGAARSAIGGAAPSATAPSAVAHTLVVSADPADRALIRGTLRGAAVGVTEASDADSALAAVARCRPDLVIVDAAQGRRVIEAVRGQLAGTAHTLALVPRGQSTNEAATDADDLLTRPFSAVQLMVKVRDLLGPEVIAP